LQRGAGVREALLAARRNCLPPPPDRQGVQVCARHCLLSCAGQPLRMRFLLSQLLCCHSAVARVVPSHTHARVCKRARACTVPRASLVAVPAGWLAGWPAGWLRVRRERWCHAVCRAGYAAAATAAMHAPRVGAWCVHVHVCACRAVCMPWRACDLCSRMCAQPHACVFFASSLHRQRLHACTMCVLCCAVLCCAVLCPICACCIAQQAPLIRLCVHALSGGCCLRPCWWRAWGCPCGCARGSVCRLSLAVGRACGSPCAAASLA
jgi:hypothetical protein